MQSQAAHLARKKGLAGFGVRLWFGMQMAFHGIVTNPLRSLLTLLGVAIGVASVVSLMSIGEGARISVMEQFLSLGSNVIVVESHNPQYDFDPHRAEEFVKRVSGLQMATPIMEGSVNIKWRRIRATVPLLGVNHDFPAIRDQKLVAGGFFSPLHIEQRSPVVVLGYNVAEDLSLGRNPAGQTLSINGLDYTIMGVLEAKGKDKGEGIDDKIVIPYSTAVKVLKKQKVKQIICKADTLKNVDLAVIQLGRIFHQELNFSPGSKPFGGGSGGGDIDREKPIPGGDAEIIYDEGMIFDDAMIFDGGMISYEEDMMMPDEPIAAFPEEPGAVKPDNSGTLRQDEPITVTSLNQMVNEADQANRVMTLLLGAIAAVSLLVGGLGIMNIMLVAVAERIGEIGVRRALGARQNDLVMQFILEALYLSAFGAMLGIILGLSALGLFNSYGMTAVVSFTAIRVAVLVSLGCGLIFGVYPALSASSVPPVEALRRAG
ncbi:MAG: ABC transporter permease [Clostridiales bacterium]|nr:ABC transporter permease [Clostridiales bacterium]